MAQVKPTPQAARKEAAPKPGLLVLGFAQPPDWADWLRRHHATTRGIWVKLANKASLVASISYVQALTEALAWGWIDGQKQSLDDSAWLQKFTPRSRTSIWSKINREKARALIAAEKLQPAGLAEVERAQADGRWDRAYDSPNRATVAADLAAALAADSRAAAFFATLNASNRYAVLFRMQTAKKPRREKNVSPSLSPCSLGTRSFTPERARARLLLALLRGDRIVGCRIARGLLAVRAGASGLVALRAATTLVRRIFGWLGSVGGRLFGGEEQRRAEDRAVLRHARLLGGSFPLHRSSGRCQNQAASPPAADHHTDAGTGSPASGHDDLFEPLIPAQEFAVYGLWKHAGIGVPLV